MESETLQHGIADLPEEDVKLLSDHLLKFLTRELNRFDILEGKIIDNKGNVVIPEGERTEHTDLDQFPPTVEGLECNYCMY